MRAFCFCSAKCRPLRNCCGLGHGVAGRAAGQRNAACPSVRHYAGCLIISEFSVIACRIFQGRTRHGVDSINNLNATPAVDLSTRQLTPPRTQTRGNPTQVNQSAPQDKVQISQQAKQLASDGADTAVAATSTTPQQSLVQPSNKAIAAYQQVAKSVAY